MELSNVSVSAIKLNITHGILIPQSPNVMMFNVTSWTFWFTIFIFCICLWLVVEAAISSWKAKKEAGLLSEEVTKETEEDDIYAVAHDSEVGLTVKQLHLRQFYFAICWEQTFLLKFAILKYSPI